VSHDDAAERMLDLLTRPGWHGFREVADAAGIDESEPLVLAVYNSLMARGFTPDALERQETANGSRYRLNPRNRLEPG
jgi:hypothetical protein